MYLFFDIVQAQYVPGGTYKYNPAEKTYPQTPQANAFEMFTSIPPGNYTGVHGYSVPIYTIQIDEYKFPISIDYHGGGIKLDEISGEIGLGWNLNLGGINLSQEVRGANDHYSSKLNIQNPSEFVNEIIPASQNYFNAQSMANVSEIINGFPSNPNTDDRFEYNPDYYSYSLLNNQGKFIFDKTGTALTIPKDDVQILNGGTLMIDKKGIKYEYIKYLHTENTMGVNSKNYSHAYRISKITFPKGDIITFEYMEESYKFISNFSTSKRIFKGGNPSECIYAYEDDIHNTIFTEATIHLIKSIEYNDTLIQFKYLKNNQDIIIDREDVNGGARLEKIEIYFKEQASPIKDYKINTSYFVSPSGSTEVPQLPDYPRDNLFKRLRLDSIEERNSNQIYTFKYEDNYTLPARFSYSTDHWGVYNGALNQTPLPPYVYTIENENSIRDKLLTGGDKNPNLKYAVTGVLKMVTLPTGGSQVYEYEFDEYRVVEDENFCDDPDTTEFEYCEEEEIRYINKIHYFDALEFNMNQITPGLVAEFDLNPNPNDSHDYRDGFDYNLHFQTDHSSACDTVSGENTGIPDEDFFKVEIYESGNPNPIEILQCNNVVADLPNLDVNKNYSVKVYFVRYHGWNHENYTSLNIGLEWVQNDRYILKNKYAGTLRTKSITLKDSDGADKIKRKFTYNSFEHPEYSGGTYSGRRINTVFFTSEPGRDLTPEGCPNFPGTCQYITLSSSPSYNLNASYGKSVYYQNVTEIFEDLSNPSNNYKIEFEFQPFPSNYEMLMSSSSPIPYFPHMEYYAGKKKKERWYNNENEILKEIENHYEFDDNFNLLSSDYQGNNVLSFGVGVALREIWLNSPTLCSYDFYFDSYYYPITSSWVKHKETVEDTYENGVLKMTNTTNYNYSPTYAHLNPVSVTTTNSLGQEIKTEYEYNHPYKKDEPTTVRTYENGAATSVQQTTFQAAGHPQYVFAKKRASTLDNTLPSADLKITYDRYDEKGNLTQYTLENGIPVSIIWGYNGQYPIAKIEGTKLQDIDDGFMQELRNLSNADTDHCTGVMTECEEAKLRKRLNEFRFNGLFTGNNSQITTYTYDPLVGVTSITTPNGQIEYYKYDSSGRLMHVKDHNGNIIKKMDYHYKN